MATYLASAAFAKNQFDDIRDDLKKLPPHPQSVGVIVSWLVSLFVTLLNTLQTLFENIDKTFAALPKPPSKATALLSTGSQRTPSVTGRKPRCTKCHARGHSFEECRTANAAAMRKRVSRNTTMARSARASRASAPIVGYPAPFQYPGMPPFYPPGPSSLQVAALAVDSAELRRRAKQSARDKHRRLATSDKS